MPRRLRPTARTVCLMGYPKVSTRSAAELRWQRCSEWEELGGKGGAGRNRRPSMKIKLKCARGAPIGAAAHRGAMAFWRPSNWRKLPLRIITKLFHTPASACSDANPPIHTAKPVRVVAYWYVAARVSEGRRLQEGFRDSLGLTDTQTKACWCHGVKRGTQHEFLMFESTHWRRQSVPLLWPVPSASLPQVAQLAQLESRCDR